MNSRQKEVQQIFLDGEKDMIQRLKKVYEQAKADCELRIRELSARTDYEHLQSIIYQKQYQEVIKRQLEGVIADLESKQFVSITDYLQQSYTDGFVGTMYDLHAQGIPLIIPIRQDQVVKALQTDSKLSNGLYSRLGEDLTILKKSIRSELSRGIVNGASWNEMAGYIAKGMSSPFDKAYNSAIRISRTEGHRIQQQSALDSLHKAREKGADIVKQWDATLDSATRPWHQEADGQLRELDEDFDVGGDKMKAPGVGGSARNVCNCRCRLLQRGRWALDEKELETLKERAEFFGLDKSKNFEEFKEKYLGACEKEESKPKYLYKDTVVKKSLLKSSTYRKKFNQISDSTKINRIAWNISKDILKHRSGTRFEDLGFINIVNGQYAVNKDYEVENKAKMNKPMKQLLEESESGTIIAIHNHPGSSVPSIPDIRACIQRGYKKGIIACHDGKVYVYSVDPERYNEPIAMSTLDRLEKKGYTKEVVKRFKDAGISLEVL